MMMCYIAMLPRVGVKRM